MPLALKGNLVLLVLGICILASFASLHYRKNCEGKKKIECYFIQFFCNLFFITLTLIILYIFVLPGLTNTSIKPDYNIPDSSFSLPNYQTT